MLRQLIAKQQNLVYVFDVVQIRLFLVDDKVLAVGRSDRPA